MVSKVLSAVLAVILTTLVYTEWMHKADKSDRNVIGEKIQAAFADGVLLRYGSPHIKNVVSRDNLSGLDQGAECFYIQMIMYKEKGNPRSNALNPGYYSSDEGDFFCPAAENLLQGTPAERDDRSIWKIAHKPRLWHGVKAVLLTALPSLHYSQLTWMIKLTTFCGLALFAMLVVAANRRVGLAYIPFVLSAFYCSSILFFGGVVYSVPLMAMVLWGVAWLAYRLVFGKKHRALELFLITAGGTLHSFFFQMDGAEIYSVSLIFFMEIFLSPEGPNRKSLLGAFESCLFYVVGFVGSTLFKNLLVVIQAGSLSALNELIANILIRSASVTDTGRQIGLFDIVNAQFYWYGASGYSIKFLHLFVDSSKYLMAFLAAFTLLSLGYFHSKKKKKEFEHIGIGFCGVLLMLAVVVARYMVLRQHSDIHIFFVSRYLFVFAGTVFFYGAWLVSTLITWYREQRQSRQSLTTVAADFSAVDNLLQP